MVPTRGNKVRFVDGEKVLCYEPDPSMAKVLYESKILECIQDKDERGRKVIEYRIHFNGWNSSWDRCVPEEFILPDTEENRAFQRKLFQEATVKLKRNMRKRSSKEKSDNRKQRKRKDSDDEQTSRINVNDSGSDTSSNSQFTRSSYDESSGDESKRLNIELDIPVPLKNLLTFDYFQIKTEKKLLRLPCQPNVITVLESFVKSVAVNILWSSEEAKNPQQLLDNHNRICLCKEVVDGLRIYFDFMLKEVLLYNEEQAQCVSVMNAVKKTLATSPNKNVKKVKVFGFKDKKKSFFKEGKSKESKMKSDTKSNKETRKENSQKSSDKSSSKDITKRMSQKQSKDIQSIHVYPLRNAQFNTYQESKKKSDSVSVSSPCNGKSKNKGRRHARGTSRQHSKTSENVVISAASPTTSTCRSLRFGRQISPKPSQSSLKSLENKIVNTMLSSSSKMVQAELSSSCEGKSTTVGSSHENLILNKQSIISNNDLIIKNAALKLETNDANNVMQENLNDILAWKLLPDDVYKTYPIMPTYVYGAAHLLRMFVKIPDLLKKTEIKEEKMKVILQYIQEFLQYLTERKDDLFPKSAYIDA